MDNIESETLSIDFGLIVRTIITGGRISKPYNPKTVTNPPQSIDVKFLWDTGATSTVITKEIANRLGLTTNGKTFAFGVGGKYLTDKYVVNIELSNGVKFPFLPVTEGQLTNCDVLIGMDVIRYGDFSITNYERTKFSFRVPSIEEK